MQLHSGEDSLVESFPHAFETTTEPTALIKLNTQKTKKKKKQKKKKKNVVGTWASSSIAN